MKKEEAKKQVLSILVENQPGALARIAGLFSGRGYNIESLAVAPTMDAAVSRMTIMTRGDHAVLEQIKKQLNKLINVLKVVEVRKRRSVQRELAMVKVTASAEDRTELMRIVEIFRGRVVDVSHESYTVEITGKTAKIEAFLELVKPMKVGDVARTGPIALNREPL
ncbi:MAG: acetolactate synthase small subunit [Deltaproteobacteria bacterium]|nr:acetolactate synthase small subunit [Deltaproteobacteria bacterium]MBW1950706.1 acetolactate synthase small subunit [Deltaproteobacteria bacterium]MBW2008312.1 acetolactate synthase small subunit [Deltaproteobacteria bacterium]